MEKRKRKMKRYGLRLSVMGNVNLEARLPFVPVVSDEGLEREEVKALVKTVLPPGSWVDDDFDVVVVEVITEEDVKPKGRKKSAWGYTDHANLHIPGGTWQRASQKATPACASPDSSVIVPAVLAERGAAFRAPVHGRAAAAGAHLSVFLIG